jgi:hypothetical protein
MPTNWSICHAEFLLSVCRKSITIEKRNFSVSLLCKKREKHDLLRQLAQLSESAGVAVHWRCLATGMRCLHFGISRRGLPLSKLQVVWACQPVSSHCYLQVSRLNFRFNDPVSPLRVAYSWMKSSRTELVRLALAPWSCIRKVFDSNFRRDTAYPESFRGFPQPLKGNTGAVPLLGHCLCFRNPFQSIIHLFFSNSTLYNACKFVCPLCTVWGFHSGDYEECRLLGCGAV